MEDKYVGLALAICSSLAIGSSFVITKKGLMQTQDKHGFEGDGYTYLKNITWWAGMLTMAMGEAANFAAYAFAPAILVTPLGALSVLIGSVLGSYFLNEKLGKLGRIGCATCLIGSIIIVLHAPPDQNVESINKILSLALSPGFLIYSILVIIFSVVMIYKVAPVYGKQTPLIYLSICSTVGSISIMAVKAFGIALKLTFNGHNQFKYASTYVFIIIVVVAILTQMNYFNKALNQFSTNLVNPIYYVFFTTFTLIASFILFRGFNTTSAVNTISLLCGFLVIFSGVYLLNLSRADPDGTHAHSTGTEAGEYQDAVPTDSLAAFGTRRSMQARRSSDAWNSGLPLTSPRPNQRSGRASPYSPRNGMNGSAVGTGDQEALMRGYDDSNHHSRSNSGMFGLTDVVEDSDEEGELMSGRKRTSFDRGSASDDETKRESAKLVRGIDR